MDTTTSPPARHVDGLIGCPSDTILHRIDDRDRETAGTQSIAFEHSSLVHRHRSLGSLSQTALTHSMPHNGKSAIERFRHLKAARAHRTTLQYEFQVAKKRWKETNKAYHKARSLYEKVALNPFADFQPSGQPGHDSVAARSRLNRLETDLESQCSNIRHIKGELQAARTSLERSERGFMELMDNHPMRLEPQDVAYAAIPTHDRTQDVDLNAVPASSDQAPPWDLQDDDSLRDAYFRRAADVNIYGEQLADLNYDYWTTLADRERRQDQEETLSIPDDIFQADAERRREVITEALDEAIKYADKLKDQCLAAGLDLNPHRRNIWDLEDDALSTAEMEHRTEYRKTFEAALAHVPPEAFENAELVLATPSDNGSEPDAFIEPSQRVKSWVESVPPSGDVHEKPTDEFPPL